MAAQKETGSSLLFRTIKNNSKILVVAFSFFAVVLTTVIITLTITLFVNFGKSNPAAAVVLLAVFVLFDVLLIKGMVNNSRIAKNPLMHKAIKNDPSIPSVLDEAYGNRIEDNKLYFYSSESLVLKKTLTAPIVFSDVLLVYESVHKTNGIKDGNSYVVSTLKRTDRINIYGLGKQKKQDLIKVFAAYCPQARFGFTPENLEYVRKVRETVNTKR